MAETKVFCILQRTMKPEFKEKSLGNWLQAEGHLQRALLFILEKVKTPKKNKEPSIEPLLVEFPFLDNYPKQQIPELLACFCDIQLLPDPTYPKYQLEVLVIPERWQVYFLDKIDFQGTPGHKQLNSPGVLEYYRRTLAHLSMCLAEYEDDVLMCKRIQSARDQVIQNLAKTGWSLAHFHFNEEDSQLVTEQRKLFGEQGSEGLQALKTVTKPREYLDAFHKSHDFLTLPDSFQEPLRLYLVVWAELRANVLKFSQKKFEKTLGNAQSPQDLLLDYHLTIHLMIRSLETGSLTLEHIDHEGPAKIALKKISREELIQLIDQMNAEIFALYSRATTAELILKVPKGDFGGVISAESLLEELRMTTVELKAKIEQQRDIYRKKPRTRPLRPFGLKRKK